MNWYLVVGVVLFILIVGSIIALVWWNLAAKMAPYDDEPGHLNKRRNSAKASNRHDDGIIVPWILGSAVSDSIQEQHRKEHGDLNAASHHRTEQDTPLDHSSEPTTSSWSDAPSWNDSSGGSDSGGSSDSGGGSDSGGSSD